MTDTLKTINCPKCSEQNNYLLTYCKNCKLRISEIYTMQNRVFQVQQEAGKFVKENNFIDALRAYAILLEYKPKSLNYLKGLCWAYIGLNQYTKAIECINIIKKRRPNDSDVSKMEEICNNN